MLQQVHYWLDTKYQTPEKFLRGHHWTYNTYAQWQEQMPFISISTIKRVVKNLEEMGLLVTFIASGFRKRKYYRIDYARLDALKETAQERVDFVNSEITKIEKTSAKKANPYVAAREETGHDFEKGQMPLPQESKQLRGSWKNEVEMVRMFSQMVLDGRPLALYPERQERLAHVFAGVCDHDMDQWSFICDNVTRSTFLMGESKTSNFKASLDWVATEENAARILEAASYGIGDRQGYMDQMAELEEVLRQSKAKEETRIQQEVVVAQELALIEDDAWRAVAAHYMAHFGIHSYLNILKHVRFEVQGDAGELVCADEETRVLLGSAYDIKGSLWAGFPELNVWNVTTRVESTHIQKRCA